MTSTETRSVVDRAVELARAEKASEEIYGSDWWDMTRYLGSLPDNRGEVAKVYKAIAPILGSPDQPLSHSYLSTRRSLAKKMHSNVLRSRTYYKLPPRVTLEWSTVSGPDAVLDTETAKKLIAFDREGRSLREIYDILPAGGKSKPPSWQSAAERAAAEERIRQEAAKAALTPENVARAIREDPQVRQSVVADADTRSAIYRAHNDYARDKAKDVPPPKRGEDDKANRFLQAAEIVGKIDRMSTLADELRRLLKDHAVDAETRSTYAGSLAQVGKKVNALVESLRSDAEFEAMLAREGLA